MNRNKFIEESLIESADTKKLILEKCSADINKAADVIKECFTNGGKLLLCGNGGSAADCQHIATEFVIRLSHDIKRPGLPAIALTTDTSNLTAGGNDIGFENVFARSLEAFGNKGDVLLGISTSGNSQNVLNAFAKAKEKAMVTLAFLGGNGGKLKSVSDHSIIIPSSNVQRIQEGHITVAHIVCEIVERELFS